MSFRSMISSSSQSGRKLSRTCRDKSCISLTETNSVSFAAGRVVREFIVSNENCFAK